MVLFVIQTLLVERGRTDLHRKLGAAAAGYGVLVILFGVWASSMLETHRHSLTHDLDLSARRLLISLESVALFAACFYCGGLVSPGA